MCVWVSVSPEARAGYCETTGSSDQPLHTDDPRESATWPGQLLKHLKSLYGRPTGEPIFFLPNPIGRPSLGVTPSVRETT